MLFEDDEILFEDAQADGEIAPWLVMVVDDDPVVHDVTKLALYDFEYQGRGLSFLQAHSAAEARELLPRHPDVAVILLDVVMETDDAGLRLVSHIREVIGNRMVRIILRTGQPGSAPPRQVVLEYDINDYREKTELTAAYLFTSVAAALRSFENLLALEKSRLGLQHIIEASGSLYKPRSMERFLGGVLMQLQSLLGISESAFFSKALGFVYQEDARHAAKQRVMAATGDFENRVHAAVEEVVDAQGLALIDATLADGRSRFSGEHCVIYFRGPDNRDALVYLTGCRREMDSTERKLIEIFSVNASFALDNLLLNQDLEFAQRELMYTLSTVAEFRSPEVGRHVVRVGKYAEMLGRLVGMDAEEAELLMVAASLHDIGKIAIPDRVLFKEGALSESEWEIMKDHCRLGHQLLAGSRRKLFQIAATIALQHQEKWDGTGYPQGLRGEQIHLYGRITALADVFDALGDARCYKEAWPESDVLAYIRAERGGHFDPRLVDVFLDNIDRIRMIRDEYADPVSG